MRLGAAERWSYSPLWLKIVETDELTAETERLKQKVTDLESEKVMIVKEKPILVSENTTDESNVLYLQDEVADLSTKLKVATEAAHEERMNLHEAVNVGGEAKGLIHSME